MKSYFSPLSRKLKYTGEKSSYGERYALLSVYLLFVRIIGFKILLVYN